MASPERWELTNLRLFENPTEEVTIGIEGAMIVHVGPPQGWATQVDCRGCEVVQGIIEIHAHDRTNSAGEGINGVEDGYAIQVTGAAGGVVWVMMMANSTPPITTADAFLAKCHYQESLVLIQCGQWMGATTNNYREIRQVARKHRQKIRGIKVCLSRTHNADELLITRKRTFQTHCRLAAEFNLVVLIHAQMEAMIARNRRRLIKQKINLGLMDHCEIQSSAVEVEAVLWALDASEGIDCHLHFCHISSAESIRIILAAQKRDRKITFEICPHYAMFTRQDMSVRGPALKMNPALQDEEDRAVLAATRANPAVTNAVWALDHAPHPWKNVADGLKAPSGLPGLDVSLLLGLTEVYSNRMSRCRLLDLMVHNPARLLGVERQISPGYPADLVVIDPKPVRRWGNDRTTNTCGWTPYYMEEVRGEVKYTICRGQIVYPLPKVQNSVG